MRFFIYSLKYEKFLKSWNKETGERQWTLNPDLALRYDQFESRDILEEIVMSIGDDDVTMCIWEGHLARFVEKPENELDRAAEGFYNLIVAPRKEAK